jgi:hypothetical protein
VGSRSRLIEGGRGGDPRCVTQLPLKQMNETWRDAARGRETDIQRHGEREGRDGGWGRWNSGFKGRTDSRRWGSNQEV